MDLKLLFFIFLSFVVIFGTTYNAYAAGKQMAAGILFFGTVSAALFFGLRWFSGPARKLPTSKDGSPVWPPSINYCPDYLLLSSYNGEQVCIDTMGVSRDMSALARTVTGTPTTDNQVFRLYKQLSGKTRVDKLCEECRTKKVTWEGVWNGSICIGQEPPYPPEIPMPPAPAPAPPPTPTPTPGGGNTVNSLATISA